MSFDKHWKNLSKKCADARTLEDLIHYKKRSLIVPAGLPFKVNSGMLTSRKYNKFYY